MVAGRGEVELHLHRGKAGRRGINTQRGGAGGGIHFLVIGSQNDPDYRYSPLANLSPRPTNFFVGRMKDVVACGQVKVPSAEAETEIEMSRFVSLCIPHTP
eukprot:scaffold1818_cov151-Skeletonema_menzelii.AAC.9